MIIFELKAIGVNLIFGIFYYIMINTICFYEVKIKSKILINFLYFFITIFTGIIYISYIEFFHFKFNFYFVFFISLGYFISHKIKWFKLENKLHTFNYLLSIIKIYIKKVSLFLINYSFWHKLITIFKNKR